MLHGIHHLQFSIRRLHWNQLLHYEQIRLLVSFLHCILYLRKHLTVPLLCNFSQKLHKDRPNLPMLIMRFLLKQSLTFP